MTLDLGDKVREEAHFKGPQAKRYLASRLSHYLGNALGRVPQFWFVLEEPNPSERDMHLHGGIGCNAEEVKAVRKALKLAGGEWRPCGARYQALLVADPDHDWVNYAFKEPTLFARSYRRRFEGPSWRDDPLMITRGLKLQARALYERARRQVKLSGEGVRRLEKRELGSAAENAS